MRIVEMDLPDDEIGVYAISIVDMPAIQSNFITLSENGKTSQYSLAKVDEEKKLLVGAALIPNKQILRKDENGEPYYIYFPKSVVEKAAYNFIRNSNQSNTTIQHDKKLEGLTVVETWLVEDPATDKSKAYGLNVPKGTWMVAMKVDNDEIWENEVKSGNVKGFSIEAFFAEKLGKKKKEKDYDKELNAVVDAITQAINQSVK